MNRLDSFERYRSLLFAIAYRMLGSVTDAEDIVQETWIRWQITESSVQSPKAFLSSIVTRLCIDRLRSAQVNRELYTGTWLPEPLVTEPAADCNELAESLSFAFLILIECLSPTERAVFLLREVFDYDYETIALTIGKSVPNCRQIVRRARQHLVLRRPTAIFQNHFADTPASEDRDILVERFLNYWNQGDLPGLMAMMAEDITFWSDGGGKVVAAQKPLYGCLKLARFLVGIRRSRLTPTLVSQIVKFNGQTGVVNIVDEKIHSTFSFEFVGDRIASIFAVVNPEKLGAMKL